MCFRKATKQGYAEAHFFLGALYDAGSGVSQDYAVEPAFCASCLLCYRLPVGIGMIEAAMRPVTLVRGMLFVVALGFAVAFTAPTEAQPPQTCEVSPPRPDGKTVWDLVGAGLVTGPLPALGEFASRTLGFGGRALEMAEARAYVRKLNWELVAIEEGHPCEPVFKPEDSFLASLLYPAIWGNPFAFQADIIGIDGALQFQQLAAERALARGIFPEKYKHELQAIKTFRAKLMPPRIEAETVKKTLEMILQFEEEVPPGTRFVFWHNIQGEYLLGVTHGLKKKEGEGGS